MNDHIIELMFQHKTKAELLKFCRVKNCWESLANLCLHSDDMISWRSAWLLVELSPAKLNALTIDIRALIRHARRRNASVQREFFKLLEKLDLPIAQRGEYYNWAVDAWLQRNNPSSTRITALRAMIRMSELYPELKQEIIQMGSRDLLESLSPGIKVQANRIFQNLET